jgi:phosphate transport system substrate-binding protein
MNDDFLHRLRAEPSAKFLATLKAGLDRQAAKRAQARRTFFRAAILATLVGGSSVAAFVAWKSISMPARLAARTPSAQDRAAHSRNIISAPDGGGAAKVSARAESGAAEAGAAATATPEPTAPAVQPSSATDQPRAAFSVAGPTALILNAQDVARRPVEMGLLKAPAFTVTTSTEALAMLCHVRASAGTQRAYTDIAGASRRILPAELEACRTRGIAHVAELLSGYETVVLARSKLYGAPKLSARDIFLALAAAVPDPARPWMLIKNPYRMWSAINGALAEDRIEILGPPPSSATAAAFRQTLMEAGCRSFPWLAALEQSDPKRYERLCRTVRDDGVYVLANGSVLEHLETYPNAMALLDYREAAAKPDALAAASVDGIDPNIESINAGRYAGSRAMYLYVNKERLYAVGGMLNFLDWYVRSLERSDSVTTLVAPQRQADATKSSALQDVKL